MADAVSLTEAANTERLKLTDGFCKKAPNHDLKVLISLSFPAPVRCQCCTSLCKALLSPSLGLAQLMH